MPTRRKLTEQEEQFCLLVAKGNKATKAAEVIGWPRVTRQAISKRAKALAWRIDQIRAEIEQAATADKEGRGITSQWVVQELQDIAEANKEANPGVSVKALNLLGLELGMFAQRKIVEKKPAKSEDDCSDDELLAIARGECAEAADEAGGGAGDSEPQNGSAQLRRVH